MAIAGTESMQALTTPAALPETGPRRGFSSPRTGQQSLLYNLSVKKGLIVC